MTIKKIENNREKYIDLLLLADEQPELVEKYINTGDMFALYDPDLKSICLVTSPEPEIYEIKNLATYPQFQGKGYGRQIVGFVFDYYKNKGKAIIVGTGESPLTLPFYEKLGFEYSHRVKNFFLENYDHPIIEDGVQLIDMIYLKRDL